MPSPSIRAERAVISSIRKFVPLIAKAKAGGTNVIQLHIGDPDLPTPAPMLDALRTHDARTIPYSPSPGLPEHLAAWQAYYRRFNAGVAADDIVATAGCAEAIAFALLAVADQGDDVLCFEPLFVGFKATAHLTGVRLVPVPLDVADNFAVPAPASIEARITPRTKAIIVINPDNPTGKAWTRSEVDAILDIARRRDLFVIVDETYREFVFEGEPWTALERRDHDDRVIVIDSLSKRFSAPGARLGCVVSRNRAVMDGVRRFAMARLSIGYVEQRAVIPLLREPEPHVSRAVAEYRARRDAAVAALAAIPGVIHGTPQGAFYVVARLPVPDTDAFVRFLLEEFRVDGETVSLTPLPDFYATEGRGADEVRIALVQSPEDIRRGIGIMAAAIPAFLERQRAAEPAMVRAA